MFQVHVAEDIPEVSHKCIDTPDRSVYFNHMHRHCELLLFVRGQAEYNIDGKLIHPSPMDLLFIPAATYHYLIPTASVPYENYVIGIDPARLPPTVYERLFTAPLHIHVQGDAELCGFFSRLDLFYEMYDRDDFLRCAEALITELFTYLSYRKGARPSMGAGMQSYPEQIVRYINEHIREPLDADAVASHFHLSKSYVQNLFSSHMHIGLKTYIRQKKIYAAHEALSHGHSPKEVCDLFAFGDYSSFYRLYKQTFGIPPSK